MRSNSAIPTSSLMHRHSLGEGDPVVVGGDNLTIDDVVSVARYGKEVVLADDIHILERMEASCAFVRKAIEKGESIYGVTTGFGGMSNIRVHNDVAVSLQNNIPWPHKTGAGDLLPASDVRAGMLLRANSLIRGTSGIRFEIVKRLASFLNAGITPHVYELGSIGASGDLVPLAYVAGAIAGLDSSFRVNMDGKEIDAVTALKRLKLPPLRLDLKEGLAIMNGTSVMAGIAANCVHDARLLLALALMAHALYSQGLVASDQSFHPFIHRLKPHPGQVWASREMLELLSNSRLIRDKRFSPKEPQDHDLFQDRYSLRCLPQYLGPIVDGLSIIEKQVEVEMNSVSDNPLIDAENEACFYGGNFLGQYIGVAMDHLRYYIGLLSKHLDVQIAMLVAPEFNRGLPPSLVGNTERLVNMGLKGLQITGNAMMPLLTHLGTPLADRFPTHAEQFNQNINSQGFGSANLARRSTDLFRHYMAVALIFGIQAVDLRAFRESGQYDARSCLSPSTSRFYQSLHQVVGVRLSSEKPFIFNDDEQSLDDYVAKISHDIAEGGLIPGAVDETLARLKVHDPYRITSESDQG